MLEKFLEDNPNFDSPLMGVHLMPNSIYVLEMCASYGSLGMLFSVGIGIIAFLRKDHRLFGALVSGLFSLTCLAVAIQTLGYTIEVFRWHFLLYGMGRATFTLGLIMGGVAAVLASVPVRPRRVALLLTADAIRQPCCTTTSTSVRKNRKATDVVLPKSLRVHSVLPLERGRSFRQDRKIDGCRTRSPGSGFPELEPHRA